MKWLRFLVLCAAALAAIPEKSRAAVSESAKLPFFQWVARDAGLSVSMTLSPMPDSLGGLASMDRFELKTHMGYRLAGRVMTPRAAAMSASVLVLDYGHPLEGPRELWTDLVSAGYHLVVIEEDEPAMGLPGLKEGVRVDAHLGALYEVQTQEISLTGKRGQAAAWLENHIGPVLQRFRRAVSLRLRLVDWLEKRGKGEKQKLLWVSLFDPYGAGVFQTARDPRIKGLIWAPGTPVDFEIAETFWNAATGLPFQSLADGLGKRPLMVISPPSTVLSEGPEESIYLPTWLYKSPPGERGWWSYTASVEVEAAAPPILPEPPAAAKDGILMLACRFDQRVEDCLQEEPALREESFVKGAPRAPKPQPLTLDPLLAVAKPEALPAGSLSEGVHAVTLATVDGLSLSLSIIVPRGAGAGHRVLLLDAEDETHRNGILQAALPEGFIVVALEERRSVLPHDKGFAQCCLIAERESLLARIRAFRQAAMAFEEETTVYAAGAGLGGAAAILAARGFDGLAGVGAVAPAGWFERLARKNPELFGKRLAWTRQSGTRIRTELRWVDPFHRSIQPYGLPLTLVAGQRDPASPPEITFALAKRLGVQSSFFPNVRGNPEAYGALIKGLLGMSTAVDGKEN